MSTEKDEIVREALAHVLIAAIRELDETAVPAQYELTDSGIFLDFESSTSFSETKGGELKKKMKQIISSHEPVHSEALPEDFANNPYVELEGPTPVYVLNGSAFPSKISDVPRLGKKYNFFSLTGVSGAYWEGNADNPMLNRVTLSVWAEKKDHREHLDFLEEAAKRDHRKIGTTQDLFHFDPAATGQPSFHGRGQTLYKQVEDYISELLIRENYEIVHTPAIVSSELYETSGHKEKFGDDMFKLAHGYNGEDYLKPMNCPEHGGIFAHQTRSSKDMPVKLAEFGTVFRRENQGSLNGLFRVAVMRQDDAHIFCTPDQIANEIQDLHNLIEEVYETFGFSDYFVRFSDRPEKRVGSDEIWDKSEATLREVAEKSGIKLVENPGEGAFYGPKLEYVLTDALGREWQCGTVQLDFNLADRLDLKYTTSDGDEQPVVIHRAILGTMERFLGMMIEHFNGEFPLWLAPVQIVVTPVSDNFFEYAESVANELTEAGFRVHLEKPDTTLTKRVRTFSKQKVPLIGIVGEEERTSGEVAVRTFGSPESESFKVPHLAAAMRTNVHAREIKPTLQS